MTYSRSSHRQQAELKSLELHCTVNELTKLIEG